MLPNETFRLQLALFELDTLGVSSVAACRDREWRFPAWNTKKAELVRNRPLKTVASKRA